MKRTFRIAATVICLAVSVQIYAAKGDAKTKKGVVLKFNGFDLKTFSSANLFSRTAFMLKSNFLNTAPDKAPQQTTITSVITYQRGNTTYIYPYKHKPIMPLFKTPSAPKL